MTCDSNTCSACWEGMTLSDDKKTCTVNAETGPCPMNYFRDSATGDCAICANGCATCTGPEAADCTSCSDENDWTESDTTQCVWSCP